MKINKLFVTPEIAVALKEMGFDEPCFGAIFEKIGLQFGTIYQGHDHYHDQICSVPIWQQACDFLETKYEFHLHVAPTEDTYFGNYANKKPLYLFFHEENIIESLGYSRYAHSDYSFSSSANAYKTRELAYEAGILYAIMRIKMWESFKQ